MLTNLETAAHKLLQIVLVGQPELSQKLNSPKLRQLKQRISLRCHLDPLTPWETREYLRTRLEIAGLPDQKVFSDASIELVYRYSGGIPRLINTICDNAMVTGYACDCRTIEGEIIEQVANDLDLSPRQGEVSLPSGSDSPVSPGGDVETPRASSHQSEREVSTRSESFDLFVRFVEKMRERSG